LNVVGELGVEVREKNGARLQSGTPSPRSWDRARVALAAPDLRQAEKG